MRPPSFYRGQIILVALVFFAIFLTLSSAAVSYVTSYARGERYVVAQEQALALAEAGIDKAAYELNQNGSYAGETGTPLGAGEFTTSVTSIDANTKQLVSTGYIPDNVNPIVTKVIKVRMAINSDIVSFRFGVQVGEGGVVMDNNSQITGNLFSNGNVSGGGNAIITGDLTVAGGTQATPDQEWTTQNSTFNLGDVASRANVAQSFRLSSTNTLNKVSFNLRRVGSPGDIALRIVTDSSGAPSKTVVASGSLPASSVGTTLSYVEGTFTVTPTLTGGQTYWIIAIAAVNASNYFVLGTDTSNAYPNGTGKYSTNWNASTPVWTSAGGDFNFRAFVGGVITSISGVQVNGDAWANTLSGCTIGGDAYYQTLSSCTVSGNLNPSSLEAAPASMPISQAQIAEWEAVATAGGITSGNYSINGTQSLGPRKIEGNLTVNGTLNLTGPIWVRGNITFANNSGVSVDSSVGNNGIVIVADYPGSETTEGKVTLSNNMSIQGNGNAGSYPMILSTHSGAATYAIDMSNNSTSVILYASAGTINVSNNGGANQITAYKLNLSNNAIVTYINGLQSQSFSNGPGGSWDFVRGTYVIVR